MTISSSLHIRLHAGLKVAAILSLTAALAACSTFGSHKSEKSEGVGKENKIIAPTAEQETKNLPKGLLPDTTRAVHSEE